MKKQAMTVAQKMRFTAGILYILLAVYEMFITRGNTLYYSVVNGTFVNILALLSAPAAGAMAIWMFASKKVLPAGARRGVVIGTLLAVVYVMTTYTAQAAIVEYSMAWTFPSVFNNPDSDTTMFMYFFMILRLLIMILAAFFVTSSKESMNNASKEEKAEKARMYGRKPEEMAKSRAARPVHKPSAEKPAQSIAPAAEAKPDAAQSMDAPLDVKK